MDSVSQTSAKRPTTEALAHHNRKTPAHDNLQRSTRNLVQGEALRKANLQLAQEYGIRLEIHPDDRSRHQDSVNPDLGPHEQIVYQPSQLEQNLLDNVQVHICNPVTDLMPMQRFATMSVDEPWPLYAKQQMASMNVNEGDPESSEVRDEAARIVAKVEGHPIASSDVLNGHISMASDMTVRSRTQKEQRLVRRSCVRGY